MKTKSLWWEDRDLHVELEDGKILCFKDATVTDYKVDYGDSLIVEQTPIEFESLFDQKK